MFKKILLAAAFVGALSFAGLGAPSTAKADVCYGGGFGGGFDRGFGGPVYSYGGRGFSRYSGFNDFSPRGFSYSRGFSRGGFGYAPYRGYRNRGVSLRIGF